MTFEEICAVIEDHNRRVIDGEIPPPKRKVMIDVLCDRRHEILIGPRTPEAEFEAAGLADTIRAWLTRRQEQIATEDGGIWMEPFLEWRKFYDDLLTEDFHGPA